MPKPLNNTKGGCQGQRLDRAESRDKLLIPKISPLGFPILHSTQTLETLNRKHMLVKVTNSRVIEYLPFISVETILTMHT